MSNTMFRRNLFFTNYVEMLFIEDVCHLLEDEVLSVLHHCHASTYGGHFEPNKTIVKVPQAGFHWPSPLRDARSFVLSCDRCQRMGNISKRHEMPRIGILEVELFDVWGINFKGPFSPLHNNIYILVGHLCFQVGGSHCHPYH